MTATPVWWKLLVSVLCDSKGNNLDEAKKKSTKESGEKNESYRRFSTQKLNEHLKKYAILLHTKKISEKWICSVLIFFFFLFGAFLLLWD